MNPVNMVNERGSRSDFMEAFLQLASVIMTADGKVMRSELQCVQNFIRQAFGENEVGPASLRLKELLQSRVTIGQAAANIRLRMALASRIQLLHFLVSLAQADSAVSAKELAVLREIANALGIPRENSESIFAMFSGATMEDAYTVLGITEQASDEEVKRAYKKMAIQNHPDKVAHLGPDIQASATEKFKAINAAYEKIKAARGMN